MGFFSFFVAARSPLVANCAREKRRKPAAPRACSINVVDKLAFLPRERIWRGGDDAAKVGKLSDGVGVFPCAAFKKMAFFPDACYTDSTQACTGFDGRV